MDESFITAADYSDWCRYAGLYLHNVSHADRYRTFQQKLSRPGLVAKVVFDFLESHPGGLDLQTWRNSDVYEFGGDAAFRVEQTALALEAVGAGRAAAKIRTLRDTSFLGQLGGGLGNLQATLDKVREIGLPKLMEEFHGNVARAMPELARQPGWPAPAQKPIPLDADVESKEQVEHLLERYVAAHQTALRGDYAKYGDVRAEPGFDPERRLAELDRLRRLEADRETQKDDVQKMYNLMEKIEQRIIKSPKLKPGKIARPRQDLLDCYRKYSRRPAEELLPETRAWLGKAERFQEKYRHIFLLPATGNAALLERLAAVGAYDVDPVEGGLRVSWEQPGGLACAWTQYTLAFEYPANNDEALQSLLDAWERLCRNYPQHDSEIRQQILESFEIYREYIARIGFDGYELGADGNPTEASILKNAGCGHIALLADEDGVAIRVSFRVEWDEEHGLELSLDDEPA